MLNLKCNASLHKALLTSLVNMGLIFLSSILFALTFPNPLYFKGVGFLGFIALAPALFVILKASSLVLAFIFGFIFGFTSYLLLNHWLYAFNPLAMLIVPFIYAFYYAILYSLLNILYQKYQSTLLLASIYMAYEVLRAFGFLGYNYGHLGSALYLFPLFNQSADLIGLNGLSFLFILPNLFLAEGILKKKVYKHKIIFITIVLSVNFIYGFIKLRQNFMENTLNINLVQPNSDPWIGGLDHYKETLIQTQKLTTQALEQHPETDLIIWPETVIPVPYEYYLNNPLIYKPYTEFVQKLKLYFKNLQYPIIFGNGAKSFNGKEDFNRALFLNKNSLESYDKIKLVPFTEYFPYKKYFPKIYHYLEQEGSFWSQGRDLKIFSIKSIPFSIVICFEDTFAPINSLSAINGSLLFVNITNDSWAKNPLAMQQHLQIALFRSIENRRSLVRSSNGGITGYITPKGELKGILKPFTEGFSFNIVDIYSKLSLYSIWGDIFPIIMLCLSIIKIYLQKSKIIKILIKYPS